MEGVSPALHPGESRLPRGTAWGCLALRTAGAGLPLIKLFKAGVPQRFLGRAGKHGPLCQEGTSRRAVLPRPCVPISQTPSSLPSVLAVLGPMAEPRSLVTHSAILCCYRASG